MARIPVTIVTGFLGSGKTTLLNRALCEPGFARSAVIVNEFGAIGIDHDLVAHSSDTVLLLDNGCLCCAVKGDLVAALNALFERRATAGSAPFERLLIETSGLAEPAPLADLLHADALLASRYVLAGVVATVDAVNAEGTLAAHDTALRQVALADRIVVTKADLLPGSEGAAALDALLRELASINPRAGCLVAGRDDPAAGWLALPKAGADAGPEPGPGADRHDHGSHDHAPHVHSRVREYSLVRDEPFDADALRLFLEALERSAGPNLLRVKGLLHIEGEPDRPAVLHGAQRLVHRLAWLDAWPGPDRRSRIVFLTLDVPDAEIASMLDTVERFARRSRAVRVRAPAGATPG